MVYERYEHARRSVDGRTAFPIDSRQDVGWLEGFRGNDDRGPGEKPCQGDAGISEHVKKGEEEAQPILVVEPLPFR
jgi:hypothetical protein